MASNLRVDQIIASTSDSVSIGTSTFTGGLSGDITGLNVTGVITATTLNQNVSGVVTATTFSGDVNAGVVTATSSIEVGDSFINATSIGIGTTTEAGRNAGVGTAVGTMIFTTDVGDTGVAQVYTPGGWQNLHSAPGLLLATSIFSYTGSPQTYTIPVSATELDMYVFGAGGGSNNTAGFGGGGGFTQVTIPIASIPGVSSLTVVVGEGGDRPGQPAAYGGGGFSGPPSGGGGSGGGYSGVFNGPISQGNALAIGGGGGGSSYPGVAAGGGQGGGTTGGEGSGTPTGARGQGGTQSAGGAGGSPGGVTGSALQGGPGAPGNGNAGSGGGGYYGGGGGGAISQDGGGGGGSGYVSPLATTSPRITPATSGGDNSPTPGNSAGEPSPYWSSGIGVGAQDGIGGNGKVVIVSYT
jgi:hypothetical protein